MKERLQDAEIGQTEVEGRNVALGILAHSRIRLPKDKPEVNSTRLNLFAIA
jgi:hypothetical protein